MIIFKRCNQVRHITVASCKRLSSSMGIRFSLFLAVFSSCPRLWHTSTGVSLLSKLPPTFAALISRPEATSVEYILASRDASRSLDFPILQPKGR